MWAVIDRLGELVLDASLGALVLVGGLALAMIACRQPSRRVGLARAAVAGSLILIPLMAFSPLPRLDLLALLRRAGFDAHPAWRSAAQALGAEGPWPSGGAVPLRVLTLVYLAGAVAGLSWLVLGWWGMGWLIRRSAAPSRGALELYESLPEARSPGRPALRVSPRVRGPVLTGLVRPTILIPPHLDSPESRGSLRLALLHELAHWEESDPWFGLASGLAASLWFFLPPVWWVRSRLRLDHEFLADRRAAACFGTGEDYASSLLRLSAPPSSRPLDAPDAAGRAPTLASAPAVAEPLRGGSALFQRLLMLVLCPFPVERRPPGWWRWSLVAGLVLATLGVSTLSPRRHARCHAMSAPTSPTSPASHAFRMARLRFPVPSAAGEGGRSPAFHLPICTPADFELTVEARGDRASLSRIRVAGHPVGIAPARSRPPDDPRAWHRLRVRKRGRLLRAWIDEEPSSESPVPEALSGRLSIEPAPGRDLLLKNLSLVWPRAGS